jgi:hypothetical protein
VGGGALAAGAAIIGAGLQAGGGTGILVILLGLMTGGVGVFFVAWGLGFSSG